MAVDNEDGRFHIVCCATDDDSRGGGENTDAQSASRIEGLKKADFKSEAFPVH